MARLAQGARLFVVPCRCLVGRSTLADLRLALQQVSSEHARLSWENEHWLIRDLGSSNGTFLNSRRIDPGCPTPLAVGDQLRFSMLCDPWLVESLGSPEPCAMLLGSSEHTWGMDDCLELPSATTCEARIFVRNKAWQLERDGQVEEVRNGDVIALGGGRWRLLLPAVAPPHAASTQQPQLDMRYATLCFAVSSDEERVRVRIEQGVQSITLPSRACLYTLLILARARLSDAAKSAGASTTGAAEPDNEGWLFTDELAAMLKATPMKVNVDVHRIRQLVMEAGVHREDLVLERRPETHQLRVGTPRLRIERL